MRRFVISEEELGSANFEQASVFLDACFILTLKDENNPKKRDKAEQLLDKMQNENCERLVISNHIMTEVVHNIFKRRIRNVLFLKHRWDRTGQRPSDNEMTVLGNLGTANSLKSIIVNDRKEYLLDMLLKEEELYYSIDKLVKTLKKDFPIYREGLSIYYHESVAEYLQLINDLELMGFDIVVCNSTSEDHDFALQFTSDYQLEAYDSIHLVLAETSDCKYLITFDGDFKNDYYEQDYNKVQVIVFAS